MFKYRYLFLCVLIISSLAGKTQSLQPYIKNYTTKDYGKANTQNWSVSQDSRGIIYFGNNLKLLEFDGENWNQINTSVSGGYITSILPDSTSRIYIGSQGEFGYLFPDENGQYTYTSLSDSLDNDNKPQGNVWKVLKYKNGIIFFTQETIYFYSNDSIQIIKPDKISSGKRTIFHNIFVVDNKLYARERGVGLTVYEENKFKLLPNGESFELYGVFGMFKNPETGNILIATQEIGFYRLNNNGISKIKTPDEAKLIDAVIFGGTQLDDGNIALNTAHNGVIIIDFKVKIKTIYNRDKGLLDNDIKQVYQDNNGDLWLAMNSGLAKINYSSPISYYEKESGLSGRVKAITKFNNIIYIGTSDGLYVQDTLYPEYEKKFYKLSSLNDAVLSISKSGNYLFVGTKNALYFINKKSQTAKLIDRIDASATCWSEDKDLLFALGDNGLAIYQEQNGNFNKIKYDDWAILHNITSLVEETKYHDNKIHLWVGSLKDGVINYIIDKDFNITFDTYKGKNDGLDEEWSIVFKYGKSFVVTTVTGIMRFVDAETIQKSIKDTTIKIRGLFEFADFYQNTSTYKYFVEQNNLIWSCVDGNIVLQNTEDTSRVITNPFKSINLENIVTLYPETEKKLWAGADKGVAFINLNTKKDYRRSPNINIRKVIIGKDSVIFSGFLFDKTNNTVSTNQTGSLIPAIDYDLNNISIYFASINSKDGKKAEYTYKLEGYDKDWSPWSRTYYAHYKKISSGSYTFLVKSRNVYGIESKIAEYKFVINPPWYNTVWAYIAYFILLIIIVYLAVRISINRLKAKNEELERIVQERTKEIAKQRDEIAEQKKEIDDSINYAKRIQEAVLPHNEYIIEKIINDYFILFKPKDIVSGDFYWTMKIENKIIITAADCTGHGVPGAFMSMLGISFLDQIVKTEGIIHANEILNELRNNIIYALKQKGLIAEQKDGMDMALCVIDIDTYKVEFAGANNPLYIVSKSKELKVSEGTPIKLNKDLLDKETDYHLFEVKADKMPIAIYEKMNEFYNNEIQLAKGDCLYMFSDGFADQFGGQKGKKFKYKPFKRLILSNAQKPMDEQKEILEKAFIDWRNGYDQIDDVVVIGIRL